MRVTRSAAGIEILASTNDHAILWHAINVAIENANSFTERDFLSRLKNIKEELETPLENLNPLGDTVSKLIDHDFVKCDPSCNKHGDRDCHFCFGDLYDYIHTSISFGKPTPIGDDCESESIIIDDSVDEEIHSDCYDGFGNMSEYGKKLHGRI